MLLVGAVVPGNRPIQCMPPCRLDVQQQQQQRRRIDIHWDRGLSFLKIGLRWMRGAVYQGAGSCGSLAITSTFASSS